MKHVRKRSHLRDPITTLNRRIERQPGRAAHLPRHLAFAALDVVGAVRGQQREGGEPFLRRAYGRQLERALGLHHAGRGLGVARAGLVRARAAAVAGRCEGRRERPGVRRLLLDLSHVVRLPRVPRRASPRPPRVGAVADSVLVALVPARVEDRPLRTVEGVRQAAVLAEDVRPAGRADGQQAVGGHVLAGGGPAAPPVVRGGRLARRAVRRTAVGPVLLPPRTVPRRRLGLGGLRRPVEGPETSRRRLGRCLRVDRLQTPALPEDVLPPGTRDIYFRNCRGVSRGARLVDA